MLFAIEPRFFTLIDLGIFAAILILKLSSSIMRIIVTLLNSVRASLAGSGNIEIRDWDPPARY